MPAIVFVVPTQARQAFRDSAKVRVSVGCECRGSLQGVARIAQSGKPRERSVRSLAVQVSDAAEIEELMLLGQTQLDNVRVQQELLTRLAEQGNLKGPKH